MNDGQVRAVLAVAKFGSMTRAAEELGVTQPAVKKQIDSIEAEWGVTLFERTAHGCVPTKAGDLFCDGMRPVCREIERLREAVRDAGSDSFELALCVLPGVISPYFAEICRDLTERHPEISMRYVPMPYEERPRAISQFRADVGVYFDAPGVLDEYGLSIWPGAADANRGDRGDGRGASERGANARGANARGAGVSCMVAADSPLAARDRLVPEDLAGYDLAGYDSLAFAGLAESLGMSTSDIKSISGDEYEVLAFCSAGGVYLCRYQMERYKTLRQVPLDWDAPAEGFIHRSETSYPVRLFLAAANRVLAAKARG